MGKITVLISTTLDGFVDADNVIIDEEFFRFTQSIMSSATLGAFGRHTFETFQERWPKRLQDPSIPEWRRNMAQSLHDIPKVVFSTTLKETTWNNSTIIEKLDDDYINDFKRNGTGTMLTFGSLSLVETLIEMNAVDDYYFTIQPILPGKGESRFFGKQKLSKSLDLKYVDFTQLASGAHVIHYINAKAVNDRNK